MTLEAKKILIIEDEPALRRSVQFRLTKEGYDVTVAKDGEEGILAVAEKKPDLILLDLILPKVNGFDILKRFKAEAATKDIPVIIFTNLSQEADQRQAKALGAADFFIKSDLSIERVVEKVREFFEKYQHGS